MTERQSNGHSEERRENDQSKVPIHDHSSSEHGGDTLRPEDLATKRTPVVDVRSYGVEGDGETDDGEAFQEAVDAATPHGVLHVPYTVDLYFEQSIDVDLGLDDEAVQDGTGEQTRFALLCDGALSPAPGLGDAIHLHHGRFPYVDVRIDGGGESVETDTAIRISDMHGGLFEGYATNYDGTVFEFDNGRTRTAGVTIGNLQTFGCGQPILMHPGPTEETLGGEQGVGEIYNVWDAASVRCPVFQSTRGLSINQYENVVSRGRTEQGVVFEDCTSLTVDKFAVGGSAEVTNVTFRDIRDVHVGSLFTTHVPGTGVVIDSVEFGNFDRLFVNDNDIGLMYRQTGSIETGQNRVVVDSMGNRESGLIIHESVTGEDHWFTGNIINNSGPVQVDATDPDRLYMRDMAIYGNSSGNLVFADGNSVRLDDSHVTSMEGTPKALNGIGQAAAPEERPDPKEWSIGDIVGFRDTENGSGDGVYLRRRTGGWARIGNLTSS